MKLTEISEAVKIALTSIKTNKVRSFLASLGVVIGISVVILMGWALMSLNDVLDNLHFMVNRDFREQTNIVVAAESESDKIDSILVLMHKNPPVSSVT